METIRLRQMHSFWGQHQGEVGGSMLTAVQAALSTAAASSSSIVSVAASGCTCWGTCWPQVLVSMVSGA